MKLLIFALFLVNLSFADQKNGEFVVCVHPDDKTLGHSFNPHGCRSIVGHGGVFKSDNSVIDICEECKAQHSESPNECKITPASCSKRRPVAD